MPNYNDILLPDQYYHVFNRAIGDEKMFRNKENYRFFLRRYQHYLLPVVDTFCYCLLPNHFHFFIRIMPVQNIIEHYRKIKKKELTMLDNTITSEFLMEQFSNFFNSYAKSYNKVFNRKGKLFMDHVKRKEIEDEGYYSKLIHYIHSNPVHHGYCKTICEWPFSSYLALISSDATLLKRQEVLDWFGGKKAFEVFHQQPILLKTSC